MEIRYCFILKIWFLLKIFCSGWSFFHNFHNKIMQLLKFFWNFFLLQLVKSFRLHFIHNLSIYAEFAEDMFLKMNTLFLRLFCIFLKKSHVNTLNINSSVLKWKNVEIFIYILKSFGRTSAICGSDTWEVGRIKKTKICR